MKLNGVVQRKLELIADNTRKLRALLPLATERIRDDFFLKNGIERTLQISIEAMIDVANRIASLAGQPPAAESYHALQQLAELHVIKRAEDYRDMIRFRNFIVHRYEYIEPESIVSIMNQRLDDFDRFIQEILDHEQTH
jgi:uncharacterized protein YutE (UPF0331/DUF86 family)